MPYLSFYTIPTVSSIIIKARMISALTLHSPGRSVLLFPPVIHGFFILPIVFR